MILMITKAMNNSLLKFLIFKESVPKLIPNIFLILWGKLSCEKDIYLLLALWWWWRWWLLCVRTPCLFSTWKCPKTFEELIPIIKRTKMHSLMMKNLDLIPYDDDVDDADDERLVISIMSNKIDILTIMTMAMISIQYLYSFTYLVICAFYLCAIIKPCDKTLWEIHA